MSEVEVAWDRLLRRQVVLKTVKVRPSESELARRMLREAGILATLDDPRVVKVHDLGADLGGSLPTLYLITQFLDGRTLAAHLAQAGPLDIDEAVRIARELCEALAVVHSADVIHRDLKPANIMLCPPRGHTAGRGGPDRVVLIDFGIARPLTPLAAGYSAEPLTQPGLLVGTVAYTAPERFRGAEPSTAVDLYSLGCILFEMLTGSRPYAEHPGDQQQATAHLRAPVPSVRARRREVPAELDRLVGALLAKDPGDRPADARETARALDAISAARGVPVQQDTATLPDAAVRLVQAVEAAFAEATKNPAEDPAAQVTALEEVYELARRTLSAGHRVTWLVALRLGQAQHRAGRPDRAAGLLSLFTTQLTGRVPVTDRLAVTMRLNLARYTAECERPADAARMLGVLVTELRPLVPPDDQTLIEARFDQAHCTYEAGEPEAALPLFRALLDDHLAVFGAGHPRTAALLDRLAGYPLAQPSGP
jgi:hypothetical protein